MKPKLFALSLTLLCFVQALIAANPINVSAIDVSLIQLIANPKEYDGKVVRVIGFVRLEFEGSAIYLHEDDYRHAVSKNGISIEVTDAMRTKITEFDQKYVLLEGTFVAKATGHMDLFSGGIRKITQAQVWK